MPTKRTARTARRRPDAYSERTRLLLLIGHDFAFLGAGGLELSLPELREVWDEVREELTAAYERERAQWDDPLPWGARQFDAL